ncbi:GntR family transcriptional regulator [Gilvimarinus xylanilyticus]|uniref:GntR family transcriptional regulator n=1 Tax=Gilvimarinus xylanilyticus TaxID=2944139 RepID=A0A9X2KTD3_9GAMM|nr:GntR family transcriptional regulator [Gilvimarinus xylanilyticus]
MVEGLFLSQADSRPMYLQIMEQIKLKVVAGDWPPGFALPSIRELAAATKVSVITVKRAYRELESEGVVVTRQGRGSFVAESAGQAELRDTELNRYLVQLLDAADRLGLSADELMLCLEAALEERGKQ